MTNVDSAHELLAILDNELRYQEALTMERTNRRSEHDDPAIDAWVKDEWKHFYLRVEPIRKQQEHVLQQLAILHNMTTPAPVLVDRNLVL